MAEGAGRGSQEWKVRLRRGNGKNMSWALWTVYCYVYPEEASSRNVLDSLRFLYQL